jgi:hypothetical protein
MIVKIKQKILEGDYEIKFVSHFRGFKDVPIKGLFLPETDTILINKTLSQEEKIITIIHEYLHEIYPEWSENKIERHCLKLYRELNKKDRIFFENIISC